MKLSTKRRVVVEALLQEYPEVAKTEQVTFAMIQEFWSKHKGTVINGKRPFGYPLWITIEPSLRTGQRGVYRLPLPDSKSDLTPPVPVVKVEEIEFPQDEYDAIITAAGIKPKHRKG